MIKTDTKKDKIFLAFCYLITVFVVIVTFYPFWELVILSISPRNEAVQGGFRFITLNPTFNAYQEVVRSPEIWRSFYNSIVRVILGTVLGVGLTSLTAYPLTKREMPFNRLITIVILFTMIFGGGLIPTYLLYKDLKLINSIWALVLPSAVSAYNLIIMRNFLYTIPISLEESARIDGASHFQIWYKIMLPLSKPAMATIALWIAVGHWNSYFDAMIYMTDRVKYTLPVILRRILLENQLDKFMPANSVSTVNRMTPPTPETTKAAIIMVSTIPIILVYPFVQKYFAKGIMLGAVKG